MIIYPSTKAMPYVYILTHKCTGQFYVGYRKRNVKQNRPSSNDLGIKYFSSSKRIKEYGFENFDITILAEFFDAFDAWMFEQQLIEEYWENPLLLNNSFSRIRNGEMYLKISNMSAEAKDKLRKRTSERIVSSEEREKSRQRMLGCKPTEETRRKMSKSQKKLHAEYRERMKPNCVIQLNEYYEKYKKAPRMQHFDEVAKIHGWKTSSSIIHIFGAWNKALLAANIPDMYICTKGRKTVCYDKIIECTCAHCNKKFMISKGRHGNIQLKLKSGLRETTDVCCSRACTNKHNSIRRKRIINTLSSF